MLMCRYLSSTFLVQSIWQRFSLLPPELNGANGCNTTNGGYGIYVEGEVAMAWWLMDRFIDRQILGYHLRHKETQWFDC